MARKVKVAKKVVRPVIEDLEPEEILGVEEDELQDLDAGEDSLLSEVERLRHENEKLRQEAEAAKSALEEGSNRIGYQDKRAVSATSKGQKLWPFKVVIKAGPRATPKELLNNPQVIKAIDESEAIRMYALLNKDEKGQQLDPTRYHIEAVCTDRKREGYIRNKMINRQLLRTGKLRDLPKEEETEDPSLLLEKYGTKVN